MSEESQLIEKVSELSDDDLLRIIYSDSSQYRFGTLVYAKAEMEKRALIVDEASIKRVASRSRAESPAVQPLKILAWPTSRAAIFAAGFAGGLYLFILLNYWSVEQEPGSHGFTKAGWPFQFYSFGGYFGQTNIDWPLLLANVLIALVIGIGVGFIFTKIVSFIKSSMVT